MERELNGLVRLLRSYVTPDHNKYHPAGTVLRRTRKEAKQLIEQNIAVAFNGPYPVEKMKTELFKPKK